MEALTLDRAQQLAREVVEEFGADYVYPEEHRQFCAGVKMCVYVHDGKPSCLVGQILARHGVPVVDMALMEFRGAFKVTQDLVPGTPLDTLRFLDRIQGQQDEGWSWGSVLDREFAD